MHSVIVVAWLVLALVVLGGWETTTAGYDPRAGITLWQKMTGASRGGKPPEFLSSHPTDASRVKEINKLLPTVMPMYVAAN